MAEKYDYYSRAYLGHLIREESKDREVALLPALRGARITSLNEFNSLLELIHWEKRRLNLYQSVSKVKKIPIFTFNLKERSKYTGKWFEEEFDDLVYQYDLFLDFDGDLIEVMKDMKKVKEFFDSYELPYQIIFSGNKGCHLIIDGRYLPIYKIEDGVVYPQKEISEILKQVLELNTLDLRNNGITNRLRKIPYSLVLPSGFKNMPSLCPESIMRVALPLSDEQFNNFKIEDCLVVNVLKKIPLIRRGNLERQENISEKDKKDRVEQFINMFPLIESRRKL